MANLTEVWAVFEVFLEAEAHSRLVLLYDNAEDAIESRDFFNDNFLGHQYEVEKVQLYGKHNH